MAFPILREKSLVNHVAYNELVEENKTLKDGYNKVSDELKERDGQPMSSIEDLRKIKEENVALKEKSDTNDAKIQS